MEVRKIENDEQSCRLFIHLVREIDYDEYVNNEEAEDERESLSEDESETVSKKFTKTGRMAHRR